jgi:polyphosphate glucokinase
MNILAIDIGGTGMKAALLDTKGEMLSDRVRVKTQAPIKPDALVETLATLVAPFNDYSFIGVGFPGVVRHGRIITAPHLGTEELRGFDLAASLRQRLGKPVRIVNDAEMQGMAAIEGKGYEVTITLGTGVGFAIFVDGVLGPHLELSHHPFRNDETYDEQLGNEAFEKKGKKKWNHRVGIAIDTIRTLPNFDRLYIGGGNAKEIDFGPGADVKIVSNELGLRGAAFLWRDQTGNGSAG